MYLIADYAEYIKYKIMEKKNALTLIFLCWSWIMSWESIYSQVHKYWDIDTILTFWAIYTTTMDFKWNEQDVL